MQVTPVRACMFVEYGPDIESQGPNAWLWSQAWLPLRPSPY